MLVGNRNVVGISMNDSGLEFDLENALMYWRYIKYSSKISKCVTHNLLVCFQLFLRGFIFLLDHPNF